MSVREERTTNPKPLPGGRGPAGAGSPDAAREGKKRRGLRANAGPFVFQAHRIGRVLPRQGRHDMQLDAFETNGASPPRRARGFAYRLRTVTLKLNEPPAEKLNDP